MDPLPVLMAFNKMDRLSPSQKRGFAVREGFLVSAGTGELIGELLQAVETELSKQWIEKELFVPYTDRARLALIHEYTEILAQESTDQGFRLRIRSHPITFSQIFREDKIHDAR
jgi:GTP-binding protein HflX